MPRPLWIALGVMMIAVVVGSLAPGASRWLPWHQPQWTHVLVYGGLAALLHAGLGRGRRALWRTVGVVGLLGLAVELAQYLVPAREATLEDALLNLLGALLGAGAVELAQHVWRGDSSAAGSARESATPSQAGSAAEQVAQLGSDRLIPAWPLLQRRYEISSAVVVLLQQIDQRSVPMGNAPVADRAVLEAMAAAGVRCLLLKGTLLAHTVYQNPAQRARGDTDVLVAPADREAAGQVLQSLGLVRSWTVTAKTSDTQDQWQGALAEGRVVIDLHWGLLNHPAFADLFDFEALWRARQPVHMSGFEAAGLGQVDALIHAALHYFAHHGDEFRPAQWLLDGDLLWRAMDDGERDALGQRLQGEGISGVVHAYLSACVQRFDTPVASNLLADLESSGRDEWRTRLLDIDGKPVRELLFMLRARPTWSARVAHLRALLLPSAVYMRSKYPDAQKWALPWLYVRRVWDGWRGEG